MDKSATLNALDETKICTGAVNAPSYGAFFPHAHALDGSVYLLETTKGKSRVALTPFEKGWFAYKTLA